MRDILDIFRIRIDTGIIRVETVDIGQEDQQVRMHKRGNYGREVVVIADRILIGCYGVILIYNRDTVEFEKLVECIIEIIFAQILRDRVFIHQDLGGNLIIIREKALIDHHQTGLTDGGAGLLDSDLTVFRKNLSRAGAADYLASDCCCT